MPNSNNNGGCRQGERMQVKVDGGLRRQRIRKVAFWGVNKET